MRRIIGWILGCFVYTVSERINRENSGEDSLANFEYGFCLHSDQDSQFLTAVWRRFLTVTEKVEFLRQDGICGVRWKIFE